MSKRSWGFLGFSKFPVIKPLSLTVVPHVYAELHLRFRHEPKNEEVEICSSESSPVEGPRWKQPQEDGGRVCFHRAREIRLHLLSVHIFIFIFLC